MTRIDCPGPIARCVPRRKPAPSPGLPPIHSDQVIASKLIVKVDDSASVLYMVKLT
jgi:hypothetical protein